MSVSAARIASSPCFTTSMHLKLGSAARCWRFADRTCFISGRVRSCGVRQRLLNVAASSIQEATPDKTSGDYRNASSGALSDQEAQYEANYQAWLLRTQQQSAEAYAALKGTLLKRTQRGGTFLTLYIFFVVSSPAALCTMIGAGASYLYLLLLMLDVDSRSAQDENLIMKAEEVESAVGKYLMKGLGAYLEALKPRLLVPASLAAGAWYYNQTMEPKLGIAEEACLLLGFLSYKLALLIEIWESSKPRAKTREELDREARPMLPQLEDVDDIRPDLKGQKF